jgi:hypothetical protein
VQRPKDAQVGYHFAKFRMLMSFLIFKANLLEDELDKFGHFEKDL